MRLRELGQVVTGATPSTKESSFFGGEYMFITPGDIGKARFLRRTERHLTDKGLRVVRELPKNSVVVTCIGIIGKVGITSTERSASNQQINAVIPNTEVILPEFLYYSLLAGSGELGTLASRTVLPILKKSVFAEFRLRVPEVEEQKKIVQILNSAQEAKETRQRELALERERKAALQEYLCSHGTRAAATKRVRNFEIPERWVVEPLGNFCEFLQYGTSERCDADEGSGSPVLGIPNVVTGRVDLRNVKYLKADEALKAKLALLRGDVVFVRTNATRANTGKCAVFRDEATDVLFASYLIRARLKAESLLPDFVREFTETFLGKSQLSGRASNAADGKFNINTQTIRSVLIPRPSWEEQGEIVGLLNACDAKLRALEKELSVLEQLFNALLEQLLSGEVSVANLGEEYAQ